MCIFHLWTRNTSSTHITTLVNSLSLRYLLLPRKTSSDAQLSQYSSFSFLKYGSQEKFSFWCRYVLHLFESDFCKNKKSFTKMLLSFNFKNFRIFFSWKKTDKKWTYVMFQCFRINFSIIFYNSLVCA